MKQDPVRPDHEDDEFRCVVCAFDEGHDREMEIQDEGKIKKVKNPEHAKSRRDRYTYVQSCSL